MCVYTPHRNPVQSPSYVKCCTIIFFMAWSEGQPGKGRHSVWPLNVRMPILEKSSASDKSMELAMTVSLVELSSCSKWLWIKYIIAYKSKSVTHQLHTACFISNSIFELVMVAFDRQKGRIQASFMLLLSRASPFISV